MIETHEEKLKQLLDLLIDPTTEKSYIDTIVKMIADYGRQLDSMEKLYLDLKSKKQDN